MDKNTNDLEIHMICTNRYGCLIPVISYISEIMAKKQIDEWNNSSNEEFFIKKFFLITDTDD